MAIQLDSETLEFDSDFFQQSLSSHYRKLLKSFKKSMRAFVFFNAIFLILFLAEGFFFLYTSTLFSKSALIAFTLGALFLTIFSYLLLFFYYQAKKPEQLSSQVESFLQASREAAGIPQGIAEHHLSIAHATIKLSNYLHDFEKNFYLSRISFLTNFLEKFSTFCHFEDVFRLKQILLKVAVDEHIKQIRITPTDIEAHTSLANTYVLLSKLYAQAEGVFERPFFKLRFKKLAQSLEERFQKAAKRAIEEFTIINHYAPDDPWIHMQLAESYRDLGMFSDEISEYETILRISPSDQQILFRLGVLYFEQGENAKGLRIYEKLKTSNVKKAEDLLSFYGSYRARESFQEM